MKRIGLKIVVIAFLAIVVSCGKTTKGKMSEEWKVVASEEMVISSQSTGAFQKSTIIADEETQTTVLESQEPGEEVHSSVPEVGTILQNEMTINKNGTWSSICDVSFPDRRLRLESSGTWNFIRKNNQEGFGRNERVLFNTLKDSNKQFDATGNSTFESDQTFLSGHAVRIYSVVESTSKALKFKMESETKETYSVVPTVYNQKTELTITLKKK